MKTLQILVLSASLFGLTSCAHQAKKSCCKTKDSKSCDIKKKKSCCGEKKACDGKSCDVKQ
jgi:hypothetical protein